MGGQDRPVEADRTTPSIRTDSETYESMKKAFGMAMRKFRPLPEHLTHYTTQGGAKGIIYNNELWATDPRFLNDRQELHPVRKPILAGLQKFADVFGNYENARRLVDAWRPNIEERSGLLFGADTIYVACFCEQSDLLSQWRGYGGTDGPAYALTFKSSGLAALMARAPGTSRSLDPQLEASLVPAIYTDTDQRDVVYEVLSRMAAAIIGTAGDLTPEEDELAADGGVNLKAERLDTVDLSSVMPLVAFYGDVLSAMLPLFFSVAFKNRGFEEEREWRLVVRPRADTDPAGAIIPPNFRPTRLGLAPFCSVTESAGLLPLVKVRQGPMAFDPELGVGSMRQMLRARGHAKVQVDSSDTSYRPS